MHTYIQTDGICTALLCACDAAASFLSLSNCSSSSSPIIEAANACVLPACLLTSLERAGDRPKLFFRHLDALFFFFFFLTFAVSPSPPHTPWPLLYLGWPLPESGGQHKGRLSGAYFWTRIAEKPPARGGRSTPWEESDSAKYENRLSLWGTGDLSPGWRDVRMVSSRGGDDGHGCCGIFCVVCGVVFILRRYWYGASPTISFNVENWR